MTIRLIATNAEEAAAVRDALASGALAGAFGDLGVAAWQTGPVEEAIGATPGTAGRHSRQAEPAVPA